MEPEYFYTLLWLKDEFFMKPEVMMETNQLPGLLVYHPHRTDLLDILSLYAVTAVKLEAHLCSKV